MANLHSTQQTLSTSQHPARGFTQTLAIHPAIALFTLCLDTMLWGGETVTLGMSFPLSVLASGAVGYVTYHGQKEWFGDTAESAKTKAVILGFLTFLPTGLPTWLLIPAGVLGKFKRS